MDALKKAEQEKKAAANRLEQTQSQSYVEEEGDDNEVISKEITGEHKKPITELGGQSSGAPIDDFASTAQLSLAPLEKVERQEGSFPEISLDDTSSEEVTLNITAADLNIDQLSEVQDELDEKEEADVQHESTIVENLNLGTDTSFDETFHGVSLGDDDPELFQETMQGEAYIPEDGTDLHEETLPGVSAVQFAKDIGSEDLPTPVAAQTVFTATNTVSNESSTLFKWGLIGLTVLVLGAGSVWYYYTVTPVNRNLPSPIVARGIENVLPPVQAPLLTQNQPLTGSLSSEEQQVTSAEQNLMEQPASDDDAIEEATVSEAQMDDVQMLADGEVVGEDGLLAEQDSLELTQRDMPASENITVEPERELIKISRSKAREEKGDLINQAYSSYQAGQFESARQKYKEVLDNYPDNRDALLGLAAIATKLGDTNQAYVIYSRLIRINPKDSFAKALLINAQPKANFLNSESTIKSMLRDNSEQPVLYFSLGNIYAKQSRWSEAQQAFFDAYRLDSSNQDYALNLAVSLDHIGQAEAAIDYYNVALKLSDETSGNFDPARVMSRIKTLSGVVEP